MLEEDVEDDQTPQKTANDKSPGVEHATPATLVSAKASKLAYTFRSLYKPSGPSSLKYPPTLRATGLEQVFSYLQQLTLMLALLPP
mmetsp:Transcript_30135/g.63028  ORF Transcript_30135/g.63028 Transcript_30135/m.63028 type:complete len:86 (-) Transcript_30135:300-557(-)